MPLAVAEIRAAVDSEVLFNLLSAELSRLLPADIAEDRDRYHEVLQTLPRGLRAMAGMHFFDVSMTLDSMTWHFGNQNDERDLKETLDGLRELELFEIADMFQETWKFMEPYMGALKSGDFGGKDPDDWFEDIGAQDLTDPMDSFIWDYCEKAGKLGLLESWSIYARKYPERCVVAETLA